jgi:hypothetical protein
VSGSHRTPRLGRLPLLKRARTSDLPLPRRTYLVMSTLRVGTFTTDQLGSHTCRPQPLLHVFLRVSTRIRFPSGHAMRHARVAVGAAAAGLAGSSPGWWTSEKKSHRA